MERLRREGVRRLVAVLLVALLIGCQADRAGPTGPAEQRHRSGTLDTPWASLSQAQRNAAVISRGLAQLGQVTGQSCKEWVRTVVRDASDGAVIVPATRPNGWQWYGSPHVRLVAQNVCPASLQPGHIVQLVRPSGLPHTAIVHSFGPWGMRWLDANWVNYNSPVGTVALHVVTWPQFYSLAASYSLYEITG